MVITTGRQNAADALSTAYTRVRLALPVYIARATVANGADRERSVCVLWRVCEIGRRTQLHRASAING